MAFAERRFEFLTPRKGMTDIDPASTTELAGLRKAAFDGSRRIRSHAARRYCIPDRRISIPPTASTSYRLGHEIRLRPLPHQTMDMGSGKIDHGPDHARPRDRGRAISSTRKTARAAVRFRPAAAGSAKLAPLNAQSHRAPDNRPTHVAPRVFRALAGVAAYRGGRMDDGMLPLNSSRRRTTPCTASACDRPREWPRRSPR